MIIDDMQKTYDHKSVEDRLYKLWEKRGYFKASPNMNKKPYTVLMPPPNITGQLHLGHALDCTMQDALIRYKRMCGYEALWLPGTDHASIATEVKIVEAMAKEGIKKEDIGREKFLERAFKWRDEYGTRIVGQLKKLGSSCDWDRERFTMDEGCSRAVSKVFVELYKKGLIYRGNRIINWCPGCKTAISDAETEYQEQDSNLWHVRYTSKDGSFSIVCATTRPETILGDTAIAVNPEDERYLDVIGKTVIVPVVGREIPIVADDYVEKDFGTGAVKITPSHDPNDFEVGARHNLPHMCILTEDGHINELGGKYAGLSAKECRKQFVDDLREFGALVKIEPYKHNVGVCYRCHTTIEPMVSKQWFVSMKDLAEPAKAAVRDGLVKFVPERFEKTYFNWMDNIRDWCISRQLWWGHRIPVWYCDDCGHISSEQEAPSACEACGSAHIHQDEDVLDTWFSSGMWPFSTLGYPDDTQELKYFYPTSTLVTGYDLIFFWVARMIVFGMDVMHTQPFDKVYIHGLVRDDQGRKMSKSLGNGVDPLKVIEEYGADSLRFSLITGNSAGNDMRFYSKKVEAARNFCNKVYNAARFVLMNTPEANVSHIDYSSLDLADKWILGRLNNVVNEVRFNLDSFDLNLAAEKIYDFIWSELCDWYIEIAKESLYGDNEHKKLNTLAVLNRVLSDSMKLLHPFMPFLTEELYTHLCGSEETIMLSSFPEYDKQQDFTREIETMQGIMDVIRSLRNIRADMGVPPSKRTGITIVAEDIERIRDVTPYFVRLASASAVELRSDNSGIDSDAVSAMCPFFTAYVPMGELIDFEKEIARVEREIEKQNAEIMRYNSKLGNEGFVAKAPQNVIELERKKLDDAQVLLKQLSNRLEELNSHRK